MKRRTKIICTLGPASRTEKKIGQLMDAGMDVARLNFSHGTHEEHGEIIRVIRKLSKETGKPVSILQDLQGPKMRVGHFRGGAIHVKKGEEVVLTIDPAPSSDQTIPVNYGGLPQDVKPSDRILIDDGLIQLKVIRTGDREVVCRVIEGGRISDHKGINLPGVRVSAPPLTEKDMVDLQFGIQQKVDYVALSFVRDAGDLREVKKVLRRRSVHIPVIAKLENPDAIRKLDEILEVSEGVMLARGDLGVEMSPEEVPLIQKRVINEANAAKVLVITATQMLESMVSHLRPTRAEASDVANAIFDGTDAVMLSAETASGDYPVEALSMMARIVSEADRAHLHDRSFNRRRKDVALSFPEALSEAAAHVAVETHAKAIVVFTHSGGTARFMSKYRPTIPIIAFTPDETVQRRMGLFWGVVPKIMEYAESTDHLFGQLEAALLSNRFVKHRDAVVVLSGTQPTQRGVTNMMKLHRIE